MNRRSASVLRLAGLLIVALTGCVSTQPAQDIALPTAAIAESAATAPSVIDAIVPTTQPFVSLLPSPTPAPTETPTPSPLPSTDTTAWPRVSLLGGGTFAHPPDATVRMRFNMNYPDHGFSLDVHSLPPDQESELYHEAGDTWRYRESPQFRVPWTKALRINGLDWPLNVTGYSEGGLFVRRPDLDYLFAKGALTSATLNAVHYEKDAQLAVIIGTSLSPDQLVLLDAKGGDGIFPDQFMQFIDILNTISFGAALPAAAQPTSGSPTVPEGAIPSAQPFISPLPVAVEGEVWPAFLLPGGGSFAYPPDAEVNAAVNIETPDLKAIASPWVLDIQISAIALEPAWEPDPCRAGDKRISKGGNLEYRTDWADTLNVNGVEWCLRIGGHGRISEARRRGESVTPLDYASLSAAHYDKDKQRIVGLSAALTPEQLALLQTSGGDAIFPEQFKLLTDILSTITFGP